MKRPRYKSLPDATANEIDVAYRTGRWYRDHDFPEASNTQNPMDNQKWTAWKRGWVDRDRELAN